MRLYICVRSESGRPAVWLRVLLCVSNGVGMELRRSASCEREVERWNRRSGWEVTLMQDVVSFDRYTRMERGILSPSAFGGDRQY